MEITSVCHITREYRGIAEAGGIKDVVRDLSESLSSAGIKVSVIIPFYGFMESLKEEVLTLKKSFTVAFPGFGGEAIDETVEAFGSVIHGVEIFCLAARHFIDKNAVYTYTRDDSIRNPEYRQGRGHADAVAMGVFFQLAAVEFMVSMKVPPSIIHCHDAHTALIPALIREGRSFRDFFTPAGTVVTIHNAGPGYIQEVQDIDFLHRATGIPRDVLVRNSLNGAVNPFLLASEYSVLNTVSNNYARELIETEEFGFSAGLGKALRDRGIPVVGITNGVNPDYLDPRDSALTGFPASFDPAGDCTEGKNICKADLLSHIRNNDLPAHLSVYGSLGGGTDIPLYVLQARLTYQKGIAILLDTIRLVFKDSVSIRILVQGQGERDLEEELITLAVSETNRGRFCFIHGYDERTTKLLFAGADFFLIPSVYEPCGITDLFSLLCGTIPIVHRVGGLIKIEDGVNGYSYDVNTAHELLSVILRSSHDHACNKKKLTMMRKNGFNTVLSRYDWNRIARKEYIPLYESCTARPVLQ